METSKREALALLRHHAESIRLWIITTCDPVAIAEQKADLREHGKRVTALINEYLGPEPKQQTKRLKPRKSKPKRRKR